MEKIILKETVSNVKPSQHKKKYYKPRKRKEEKFDLADEFKAREGSFYNKFTKDTKPYSEASMYDVREMLAEEFRNYILLDRSIGNKIKNFFKNFMFYFIDRITEAKFVTAIFWQIIFFKLLITPEILYGYQRLMYTIMVQNFSGFKDSQKV